jgi:NTP pyrophosphatase (non-canonical NTP hydrolase)
MPGIADLAVRLRTFAAVRGWERLHTPKNLLMALAGEVGELAAELQWLSESEADPQAWDAELRERVSDEIADVMIYLVRFADVCSIDPLAAANRKIDRNETRFPPASSVATGRPAQSRIEARTDTAAAESRHAVHPDRPEHH